MKKYRKKEFYKRYEKFKKNNLPTPFYDNERQTFEWVYYTPPTAFYDGLQNDTELSNALGVICQVSFHYPYICKYFDIPKKGEGDDFVIRYGEIDSGSFNEVVYNLYQFPESFSIPEDKKNFYSEQELYYLSKVQKYLLFIGLKDVTKRRPGVSRYRNKIHSKLWYQHARICDDKVVNKYISGKLDYILTNNSYFYEKNKKVIIVDKQGNIRLLVKLVKMECKKYSEIGLKIKNIQLKNDDEVYLVFFEIIEKFDVGVK